MISKVIRVSIFAMLTTVLAIAALFGLIYIWSFAFSINPMLGFGSVVATFVFPLLFWGGWEMYNK